MSIIQSVRRPTAGPRLTAILLLGLSGAIADPADARDFKCWKASNGELQCGEVVPPDQQDLPATLYDGRGHRVSDGGAGHGHGGQAAERKPDQVQSAAESPSENDRALLRDFPTLADLTAARDHELAAIETLIETENLNVRSREAILDRLRTQAADLERAGRPVTRELHEKIGTADRAARDSRATVELRTQERAAILQSYELKIERFRHLKGLPPTPAPAAAASPSATGNPAPGSSRPP